MEVIGEGVGPEQDLRSSVRGPSRTRVEPAPERVGREGRAGRVRGPRAALSDAAAGAARLVIRGAPPPGWRRNPSAWSRRLLLVALAAAGCALATYLTLYQLGIVAAVWDPVFGDGSQRVLRSALSRARPIPDAALGAAAYAAELVALLIGGGERWRTRPRVVLACGAVAAALAGTSVLLLVLQAAVIRSWCFLCIVSAGISFAVAAAEVDEIVAAVLHAGG